MHVVEIYLQMSSRFTYACRRDLLMDVIYVYLRMSSRKLSKLGEYWASKGGGGEDGLRSRNTEL